VAIKIKVKIIVVWDVIPCSLVEVDLGFPEMPTHCSITTLCPTTENSKLQLQYRPKNRPEVEAKGKEGG
jgi:hypothetical protein